MAKPEGEAAASAHGAAGYLTSAIVFAGLAALWAVMVRADPFYRPADLGGVGIPVMMIGFLAGMPLIGFLIGRWRYHQPHQGGALSFGAKLVARGVHFTYAHTLVVMFTVAMAMDTFLGFNIDAQVRALDDQIFDAAARFAPWLCAYLAGFNLGRATRKETIYVALAPGEEFAAAEIDDHFSAVADEPVPAPKPAKGRKRGKARAEPARLDSPFVPGAMRAPDEEAPAPPPLTASGLPQAPEPAPAAKAEAEGFLPPQDFSRLRPGLRELR